MFLGIDVGTGSSKAVLTDAAGVVLAHATVAHEVAMPRPGFFEFDAAGVGWAEVAQLARTVLAGRDASQLQAVCVSAMGPCLIVTDDSFEPLRPTILYGIDSRSEAEVVELTEALGGPEIFAACGKALSSQAVGPKLRWIRNHEPDVFARATHWFGLSSWLVAKLTGEYVQDHHTASQSDPLYDLRANDWHAEWSGEVAEHLRMPRLTWPSEVVGSVTPAASAHTGIPAGVPVCAGTVDAWAEAFSAGVRRPGDLMLMYGSTMFFVEVLERLRSHEKLWTTAGVAPGTLSLAAGMSTSGSLTTWLQRLVGDVPFETLVSEASAVPAGADGLLLLPYLAGERTPIFDPDARGLAIGLTLQHERGHLLRAAYEGIGFGIRQIVSFLEDAAEPIQRIVAVGGGTKAGLWTQIVSDITGREQQIPEQTIGASYGDALMAAIGSGAVPAETDWTVITTTIAPDPANAVLYGRLFEVYESLYPATREHMHALAALQHEKLK